VDDGGPAAGTVPASLDTTDVGRQAREGGGQRWRTMRSSRHEHGRSHCWPGSAPVADAVAIRLNLRAPSASLLKS
jgi:hypothetical protein